MNNLFCDAIILLILIRLQMFKIRFGKCQIPESANVFWQMSCLHLLIQVSKCPVGTWQKASGQKSDKLEVRGSSIKLAPQIAPHISKVPKSAVSVFSLDSGKLLKDATNGVYFHMENFWQTFAFGTSTCNEWITRIPHSHLQHLDVRGL